MEPNAYGALNKKWNPISVIQSKLLDFVILIGALFALTTTCVTLSISEHYFNTFNFYTDLFSIVSLFAMYFFRNTIPLKNKVLIGILFIYVIFITSIIQYGTISNQRTLIILIPFLLILLYDFKKAVLVFFGLMTSYFFIAFLYLNGILNYEPETPVNSNYMFWVISGIVTLAAGLIIIFLVNNYNNEIYRIVSDLEHTTEKLKIRDQQHVEHLKEKNTMIQEIHHRVKNNLAVVSGLLMLQMSSIDDEKLTIAMQKSVNRIMSIAKVHQMLYQSEDFNKIPFKQYVDELADEILSTMNSEEKNIQFQSVIDIEYMSISQSVPLGIIFNELITNSIKYGFRNKTDNKIEITVTKEQQKVHVCYTDNGPGIMNFEEASSKSLGFSLIESLFTQIDATFEYNTTQQFRLDFRFPLDDRNA